MPKDPAQLAGAPINAQSGDLGFFPSRVLDAEQRSELNLAAMVEQSIRGRTLKILAEERREWDQVKTLSDWERFRDRRIKALAASVGALPSKIPFRTRLTTEFRGEGYRRQNLAYESRPGLWVTSNLYLPASAHGQVPGILIVHSHHAPKTQFELQDMGIIWARAGCAVLVIDQIGYGERMETYPWDREAHNSSHILGMQLQLAGENLLAWTVWDIIRGIDVLLATHKVNEKQIIVMGAVAGGGDPAAVAAALDSRIAAVVPFNFGEAEPEEARFEPAKNQWPLEFADPGWGDMVSTAALPRATVDQFFPWTICASVAPRRFVYSFELGWNVEDLPAWARYKKVFNLYRALDHLADAHGFGPFPGPGECWNIGPAQRKSLYPTLERWFGIPIPFDETRSSVNDNLARRPEVDRRPISELAVLNPQVASELHLRTIHDLAHEEGRREMDSARAELGTLSAPLKRQWLRKSWGSKLGDIDPNDRPEAKVRWSKEIPNGEVEGITLTVEPGIIVPLLLLHPQNHPGNHVPVVVAVSEGGKELFLTQRNREIEGMLRGGLSVCLPDLRGTGETAPDTKLDPDGDEIREHLSASELMLGNTLLGKRLKDLRTVLAYLEARSDIDSQRLGLWGESFSRPNPGHLLLDEQIEWQIGPEIEQQAEPLGGLLALLGALYEDKARTIALRGGLVSYLSILDDNFTYVPADIIVPGALKSGDLADITAALAPRPIRLEQLIDGRDCLVTDQLLRTQLRPVYETYNATPRGTLSVASGEASSDFSSWFISTLRASQTAYR